MLVRTLLGIDMLVALVVIYFFVIGLADGSVSSFNMNLWLGFLALVAAVANGRRGAAIAVLLILAVPGGLYALFIQLIVIAQPRWNWGAAQPQDAGVRSACSWPGGVTPG